MSPAVGESTRYERIVTAHSVRPGDLAARFAHASQAARAAAAGVAASALIAFKGAFEG